MRKKKILQLYAKKRLSRLSYRRLITLLPEKQRLSLAKNFNSESLWWKKNLCNSQLSRLRLQWTFPRKTASVIASDRVRHIKTASIWLKVIRRFRLTGGHWRNTLKTHRCHHHVSWGAAAPAFCASYTAVRLYSSGASLSERPMAENWRTTAVVFMRCLCVRGATYSSQGWIWTGSCVEILPSHYARQVHGSECRDVSLQPYWPVLWTSNNYNHLCQTVCCI